MALNQTWNFLKALSHSYMTCCRFERGTICSENDEPYFEQKLAVIVTTMIKRSGDNGPCSHWTRLDWRGSGEDKAREQERGRKLVLPTSHCLYWITLSHMIRTLFLC